MKGVRSAGARILTQGIAAMRAFRLRMLVGLCGLLFRALCACIRVLQAEKLYTDPMSMFEHYMYVLECVDGSLYTGYTPNVEARVAVHQAGTGAKYTKSHRPVKLVACARFYSKERAMSAEAHFKKLDRKQKEQLVAQAACAPFEEVLCARLEGFGEDSAVEYVHRNLAQNIDLEYRRFHARLVPTVDPATIAGVRTPALRAIAKGLAKREDKRAFFKALPHRLFDENQVHAFAIGLEKDYATAVKLYDAFLPYVDNWATCDQLPIKVLGKQPQATLAKVDEWLASDHCYTIRFGIGVLMGLFLGEWFEERFLAQVAGASMPGAGEGMAAEDDVYYVNMMRAWYFAEALAKQEAAALPYFEARGDEALLDEWTRRKAIQKAIESRRVSLEMKDHLRRCR